jgi:hypothetical protein
MVDAASPVLIEGSRAVVTDETGQYRIVDLRPGVYTVTFTLAGFNTMQRAGIEVMGSFTATVNAELRVGTVAETVTVTGQTPTVDVQTLTRQRTISQDVVDKVPAARTYYGYAALVPGIISNTVDVGGALGNQNANSLRMHGGTQNDQQMTIGANGVLFNSLIGSAWGIGGAVNMGAMEEVNVDYAAVSADNTTGGVRVNFIPREGGNTFAGNVYYSYMNTSMQSSNFSQELKDQGLRTPSNIKTNWDINPSFGGPIRRDVMWFFFSSRVNRADNYVADQFVNLNANNPSAWTYAPDLSKPASNDHIWKDNQLRLTWQVDPRNKIALHHTNSSLCMCPSQITATQAPEAGIDWRYPLQYQSVAEWTSPVTPRLLLQASVLFRGQRYPHGPVAGLNPQMINVTEQSTGLQYRARNVYDDSWTQNFFYRISVSHITGAHQTKFGFNDGNGVIEALNYNVQPVNYRFNNGIPNQITMRALPYTTNTPQDHNLGAYAQDRWTVRRLTLSLGVRYDYYSNSFPEQHLGTGPLTPGRDFTFPAQDNAAWHDLTPKSGAAYDLFGNGKTALKISLNKYLEGLGIGGLTADPNPINTVVSQTTRSWTDINRDYVPNCDLLNTAANGECGAMADPNFGTAKPGTTYDPARMRGWGRRGYNWEFSVGVQHQILPRVSVDVSYFRRWYGNFTTTDNLTVGAADFSTFTITAPVDPRLPGSGGYVISDLKDVNPDKFGQPARNFVTNASDYGKQTEHWNGGDFTLNARPGSRVLFQGGVSTGYDDRQNCDIAAKLPEMAPLGFPYCHVREAFLTQVKALASYDVPKVGVLLSATLQSLPGSEIAANYTASNAQVAPSLGRNLSGGAANVTVNLVAPGTMYTDRSNELDIRAAKIFRLNRTRTTLNFDLYNALNSDVVLAVNNSYAAWLRPTSILAARLFKISAKFDF